MAFCFYVFSVLFVSLIVALFWKPSGQSGNDARLRTKSFQNQKMQDNNSCRRKSDRGKQIKSSRL